jgi:hypothetical protein
MFRTIFQVGNSSNSQGKYWRVEEVLLEQEEYDIFSFRAALVISAKMTLICVEMIYRGRPVRKAAAWRVFAVLIKRSRLNPILTTHIYCCLRYRLRLLKPSCAGFHGRDPSLDIDQYVRI